MAEQRVYMIGPSGVVDVASVEGKGYLPGAKWVPGEYEWISRPCWHSPKDPKEVYYPAVAHKVPAEAAHLRGQVFEHLRFSIVGKDPSKKPQEFWIGFCNAVAPWISWAAFCPGKDRNGRVMYDYSFLHGVYIGPNGQPVEGTGARFSMALQEKTIPQKDEKTKQMITITVAEAQKGTTRLLAPSSYAVAVLAKFGLTPDVTEEPPDLVQRVQQAGGYMPQPQMAAPMQQPPTGGNNQGYQQQPPPNYGFTPPAGGLPPNYGG